MKKMNEKTFEAFCGNETFIVVAYTTRKNYETTETCFCRELNLKGKSYYANRPWQSFDYDNALRDLVRKVAKKYPQYKEGFENMHKSAYQEEVRVADGMFNRFKSAYDNASKPIKDKLREDGIFVETKEDVESLTLGLEMVNACETALNIMSKVN